MAAILNHLKLGLGGNRSAVFRKYLLTLFLFPDLTQGEAVINKKSLQVEINLATLEEEAEVNGEMYVCVFILSQMIMIYHLRF